MLSSSFQATLDMYSFDGYQFTTTLLHSSGLDVAFYCQGNWVWHESGEHTYQHISWMRTSPWEAERRHVEESDWLWTHTHPMPRPTS